MANPKFVAGAIDLAEVKAQAQARKEAEEKLQQVQSGQVAVQPVMTVTEQTFEEVAARSLQVPVILLIGTARSPHSEQLKADFTDLAGAANLQWIFAYLDADATPQLAQMFGVQALPTVVALAGGRPLADFQGGQPREALTQWIDAVLKATAGKLQGLPAADEVASPAEHPLLAKAAEALNAGDFAQAIACYDELLADDPHNQEVAAARANALLLQRLGSQTDEDPLTAAAADPKDVDKQIAAADFLAVRGDMKAVFELMIAAIKVNQGEAREALKAKLFEYFAMCEPADPSVLQARQNLASALF